MNAVNVKGLEKTYSSGVKALNKIDLEIPEGSFFGLLGPNGAGKSTLIHCLMGLAVPTGGKAEIFGKDVVSEYQEARSFVGLAPQEINLDWFLSVEDTMDFHGGYFSMRKNERRERIDELLKDFSLTEKRKARSLFLSGGMKRRVVLARALMHKPKVLILDEPTAGVDVELRRELWDYMRKINKAGTTIILTTHYIEEAEQLCDNIAMINHGKIITTGTSQDLKKKYKQKTLENVYLKVFGKKEAEKAGAL